MNKTKELTAKQTSFIENYCNPGSETYNNGYQSAIRAGYSKAIANQATVKLVGNGRIKAKIVEYKAENAEKIEISREMLNNKMLEIVNGEDSTDRDKISASSLIGDFCGFKRETALNPEKEASKQKLKDEERVAAQAFAEARTAEKAAESELQAREGIKLA